MQPFEERLEKGSAQTNAVNEEYEQRKDDGFLQECCEKIIGILHTFKLAYTQRVLPQYCGVHFCNRGGTGLIASAVMKFLEFMLGNGWSWRQVTKASAVEVPPNDDDKRQTFCEKVAKASGGLLGEVTHKVKVVTLECSHTTAVLNAVRTGAHHPNSVIADPQGRLSLARLQERSPEFAKAVEQGLEYLVIYWQVEERVQICAGFDLGLEISSTRPTKKRRRGKCFFTSILLPRLLGRQWTGKDRR